MSEKSAGKKRNQRKTANVTPTTKWPGGGYALFIVGPAMSLGVACAHAQSVIPVGSAPTPASESAAAPGTQSSSSAKAAVDKATTLNTMVVTADRRREPVRDVPMQVNVLSSQELQRKGDQDMQDYLSREPGVSLVSSGVGQNQVSIRGVTTGTDISPTVGVYVDNVPFGSSTVYGNGAGFALDMGLLDLNHIEILRGPQGTLYGAGAMGGLLKYVTNEPDTEDLSGQVGGSISGTDHGGLNHTENAVINVPIKNDVAALRVSVFDQDDSGFVNRVGSDPEKGVDATTTRGGRASLLLTPTRDLTLRFTATTQQIKSDGNPTVDYDFNTRDLLVGDYTQSRQANETVDQLIQLYSADVEYNFGWARLNAISAYQKIQNYLVGDVSAVYLPELPGYNSAYVQQHFDTQKFTQEFRLTSPSNQSLEWIAGLFYTDEHSTDYQALNATAPGIFSNLETIQMPSTYQELAAYGDLTYHFTTKLSATAGVRVAHNNQRYDDASSGELVSPSNQPGSSDDTSTTYLFTLKYLLTDASSVYARVASGYRPGGPQATYFDTTTGQYTPGTFKPDTLTTYEAGYKADFLDRRASISLSVYDIEWRHVQLSSVYDDFSIITNGGNARSKGAEIFGSLRPVPQWNLSAGLTYTDARLTQSVAGIGVQSGDRLPNTPSLSGSVNADYTFTVGSYKSYVGASETYVGSRNSGYDGSTIVPNYKLPGYFMTDLRAGIDLQKANVSFFVHNLFDRHALLSANTSYVEAGGPVEVTLLQPLTVGMQVAVPF